ncbi:alpha/beta hydrolase [Nocardia lijiangensis]|uniref:alpha/beta hydrolase n=1 Tax=Nocardia lijiangensis TaxID=299618 RepID=UPI001C3F678C|nr:alpha/beta fold hydrolase [Nocardia lijiangensis]
MAATDSTVEYEPGKHIHVWLCPGSPDRVVVLGHGIGMSKSASLAHAKFLHAAGYTVCLFDHRNHGASGTDRRLRKLSEHLTTDIVAVVSMLRETATYRSAKVALYGFSFSTYPSVYSLTRDGFTVDAIVCDSGPGDDARDVFESFLASGGLPVPGLLAGRPARTAVGAAMSTTALAMLGADWPPPLNADYESVPALLIVGGRDRIISAVSVETFAARYPRFRTLVLPHAEHLSGLKADPKTYTEAVLDFLDHELR